MTISGARISPFPISRAQLTPLQAGFWRAASEGVIGWIALTVLGNIIGLLLSVGHLASSFPREVPRDLPLLVGWLWLVAWPIWRLERIRGRHWWTRMGRGIVRMVALATVLSLSSLILPALGLELWPLGQAPVLAPSRAASSVATFSFFLFMLRSAVLILAAIHRWMGRRLRRQLMVSYLTVIMTTFVGLTALGSLIVLSLVVTVLPDARAQAVAAASALRPRAGITAITHQQAQDVLDALQLDRVRPGNWAGSPLLLFVPWDAAVRRIMVVTPSGAVVAATRIANVAQACPRLHAATPLPPAVWQPLRDGALAGRVVTVGVPSGLACSTEPFPNPQRFAAASIMGPAGRPIAVVVVQGNEIDITSGRFVSLLVAVFSASTFVVILFTVVPTLILSAIASYLFARGLTRRVVAVSSAATAIAMGDLSQRVPVNAQNEIGRLAADFNQMAAHQEAAMNELRLARTQAEEALHARQELVASVSHELRTPIAVVQAQLDSMEMERLRLEQHAIIMPQATLEALQGEMDRLATLVDDLFSLAKVETGGLQVRSEPTDVGEIVREVAALLRPLAQRERAITLAAETPPGLPLALADGDRLRQILANLVRNAVRHTPEGGIIVLSVAVEAGWVVVSVADTGEGIPAEHLPRIFERFYRVDAARSRASGGAGLGLAIVREFVELMGGKVGVESSEGEGSIFHVYLASAPVNRAALGHAQGQPAMSGIGTGQLND